jgi:hypothetical protein
MMTLPTRSKPAEAQEMPWSGLRLGLPNPSEILAENLQKYRLTIIQDRL